MNPQIQETLSYIEKNLHEEFSVESLAKKAGYSKFHFSRIFKVYVGESIMDYITRLKIEKSSFNIMGKEPIIDVALNFGYKTPNGYNKAFKKIFGISPTLYKKNKINFLNTYKRIDMQTPQIIELETKNIVYERAIGAYENSDSAWEQLSSKLNQLQYNKLIKENIILDQKDAEFFGICHDDPTVTKEEKIRYDASISWEKEKIDFLAKHNFDTTIIEGGKYITTIYKGDTNKSLNTWFALYRWCEEKGYEFRDLPPFEKYVNLVETVANPEKQITQIFIPIK